MKHVFKYLDFAEDREHAESVATKELKQIGRAHV